jgi:hypothetical protein
MGMGENKDIEATAAAAAPAGVLETAPTIAAIAAAPAEPKIAPESTGTPKPEASQIDMIHVPEIEAPKLGDVEPPRLDVPHLDPSRLERPQLDALKSETVVPAINPAASENASGPVDPSVTEAPAAGHRFTLLAASVAIAAALGAMVGALGASGVAWLAPASDAKPIAAVEPHGLQDTIAQLKSDVAALRASIDAASRNTNTQFVKISERFDRVDRAQAERRTDPATPVKETTGSIAPPTPAAAAAPVQPPQSPIIPGWVVRDVSRGVALIQGRMGLVEVEPGDVLPGLGRIEAIRRQDGRWVVVTSKGRITSSAR